MYRNDSRLIKPGDIYLCLPGGEKYINQAIEHGAAGYVVLNRTQMADLASLYYGEPSKKLTVIGVTGTNGKSTSVNLIGSFLSAAGFKPYVLGTLNSELTTPESIEIQRLMAEHLASGGTHFVMEVSSHAIAQDRIGKINFDIKLVTNITQDHLDYHKTLDNYKNTKMAFMKAGTAKTIYPENYEKEWIPVASPLKGKFNEKNVKGAIAVAKLCQVSDDVIVKAIPNLRAPAGRFQNIEEGQPFLVIVDYAHTPDSLENVLKEARSIADARKGRVLTVFGCGGDRDRDKRPKMGRVAQQYSDFFIITEDNPRTEKTTQITADILEGIKTEKQNFKVLDSRRDAIQSIIAEAGPPDIVMIAGKGHETYQILNTGTIDFDDCEESKIALKKRSNK